MPEKRQAVSTKKAIADLVPDSNNYSVPVVVKGGGARGLCVQVTPAGVKSFVLRFRLHKKQKTLTLGRFPDMGIETATKAALAKWTEINGGINPSDIKRAERKAETVPELVDKFEAEHLDLNPSKGWAKESKRLIKSFVIPAIGSMRVKDVGTADIAAMLSKIRASTPTTANRVRSVCSKLFAKAELWGMRPAGTNPAKGQDRAPEVKKKRNLSDAELVLLGKALRILAPTPVGEKRPVDAPEESIQALNAIRLLLLTGMRRSEILGDVPREIPALTWDEVDLEGGWITKTHHKTAKSKGDKRIPLCSAAVALLKSIPKTKGNPHVIVGKIKGRSLVNLQNPWNAVKEAVDAIQAEAKVPPKSRLSFHDVDIHDLRRTFASLGTRMGYPLPFMAALLGHAAGSVTEGYARVDGDPLRAAAEAIGSRLAELLDGTQSAVDDVK